MPGEDICMAVLGMAGGGFEELRCWGFGDSGIRELGGVRIREFTNSGILVLGICGRWGFGDAGMWVSGDSGISGF